MSNTQLLDDLSQAQRSRLFHIDFRLCFLGAVNRGDLVSRFGIKEAAATRDLSAYREIAAENVVYDHKAKSYFSSDRFVPVFGHDADLALRALTQGSGDDLPDVHKPMILAALPPQLSRPRLEILAPVSRAIHRKLAIEIEYSSTGSKAARRAIVPFALVSNGLRWHVRAFSRHHGEFRDFVLTRMLRAKESASPVAEHECAAADNQWMRIVDLQLVPHPNSDNLPNPEAIEADFGMTNGVLELHVRAALTGYLLRLWNVDCTEDHSLNGREYQLWLKNHPTLYGVKNANLAPGIHEEG